MDDVRAPHRQEHITGSHPVKHGSPTPAVVEQPKKPKKSRKKPIILSLVILLILLALGAGGWFFTHRNPSPIPNNIKTQAGFAIYYPSSIPAGYAYDKNSAKLQQKILFFSLSSGNNKVSISEQAAPTPPPDLTAIQKNYTTFSSISSPAGQAILGTNPTTDSPSAILATNTTLISLTGTKGTPTDVISKLVQNMSSLPQ